VKLFAILRERAGTRDLTVELADGATVSNLLGELAVRHPRLLDGASATMLAVNTEYVQADHKLHDGDEVALIPPVSGGVSSKAALQSSGREPFDPPLEECTP